MDEFDFLFKRLAAARSRYEELRISDAPFGERAAARDELNALRAQIAHTRR